MSFPATLLEIVVKSAAIVLLCAGVALPLRKRSAVWENCLWRVCLVAILAVPFGVIGNQFAKDSASPATTAPPGLRVSFARSVPRLNLSVGLDAPHPATHRTDDFEAEQAPRRITRDLDWNAMALGAYIAGVAVFLLPLVFRLLRVRLIVAASTPFESPAFGVPGSVLIRVTNRLSTPATLGLIRPVIMLPVEATDWPEDRLAVAILHEWMHVRRRDWPWQLGAKVVRAFMWFNPAASVVSAALTQSAERATDDQVVASGFGAAAYARELVTIASLAAPSSPIVVAIARRGGLKARLHRVLAPGYPKAPAPKPVGYGLVTALAVASLVVGSAAIQVSTTPAPTTADFLGPVLLNGGQTVKLVSVQKDGRFWAPDGGITSDRFLGPEMNPMSAQEKELRAAYRIRIRVERLSPDSIFFGGVTGGEYRGYSTIDSPRGPCDCLISVLPKPGVSKVGVKIGFGYDRFRLYADCKIGESPLQAREAIDVQESPMIWKGLSIAVSVPKSLQHKQLRMAVKVSDGKTRYDDAFPGEDAPPIDVHGPKVWFHFASLKQGQVVRVQLMARDIQWVQFNGIHLKPSGG